jgi:hypothetical protein
MMQSDDKLYPSLNEIVVQVNWTTPTDFVACPREYTDDALLLYRDNLRFGEVFAQNVFSESYFVDADLCGEYLQVLTRSSDDAIKGWGVVSVFLLNGRIYHRNEHLFFGLAGAVKHYFELQGNAEMESIDDYC